MTNEQRALAIQNGDSSQAGPLWESVDRLIFKLMSRYFSYGATRMVEQDDLLQAGFLAMMAAVKDYDEAKHLKFTSYLSLHCKQKAYELLGLRSKCQPDTVSLYTPTTEDEDAALLDTLEDDTAQTGFEDTEHALYIDQLRNTLGECIDALPDIEGETIALRFFGGKTLQEAADILGKHPSYIRTLEQSGLRHLRHPRTRRRLEPFMYTEIVERTAYTSSSFSAFKHTGMSSVERAYELIERRESC